MYEFSCGNVFSLLLGMHLGVELLGQVVTLFIFQGIAKLFYKVAVTFYIPI